MLNATAAAALLLGPVGVVRALRVQGPPRPPQRARWSVPMGPLVACVALVCIVAAKPGAGRHHLVPFVPLAMDALIDGLDGIERGRLTVWAARALTLAGRGVACAVVIALVQTPTRGSPLRKPSAPVARYRRAPGPARGIRRRRRSDGIRRRGVVRRRVRSPLRGLREPAPPRRRVADGQRAAAGYSATRMLGAAMAACRPRIWIVPEGEPFSMRSYYRGAGSGGDGGSGAGGSGAGGSAASDDGRVFDDPFRDAFARRYELVESRSVYRVFRCREER